MDSIIRTWDEFTEAQFSVIDALVAHGFGRAHACCIERANRLYYNAARLTREFFSESVTPGMQCIIEEHLAHSSERGHVGHANAVNWVLRVLDMIRQGQAKFTYNHPPSSVPDKAVDALRKRIEHVAEWEPVRECVLDEIDNGGLDAFTLASACGISGRYLRRILSLYGPIPGAKVVQRIGRFVGMEGHVYRKRADGAAADPMRHADSVAQHEVPPEAAASFAEVFGAEPLFLQGGEEERVAGFCCAVCQTKMTGARTAAFLARSAGPGHLLCPVCGGGHIDVLFSSIVRSLVDATDPGVFEKVEMLAKTKGDR